jgi:replicative DNA helicase
VSLESLLYEKGLPANLDAERFVLGSVLLNDGLFAEVAAMLPAEAFSIEKHRRIFTRMTELAKRDERIDRLTVANELIVQGQIESIDGMGYLVSLDEGIPELPNVERARCRWDSTMSSSRLAV